MASVQVSKCLQACNAQNVNAKVQASQSYNHDDITYSRHFISHGHVTRVPDSATAVGDDS